MLHVHMKLISLSIAMRFDAEHLSEAVRVLVAAIGPTKVKAGCRSCRAERDLNEDGLVHYLEEWDRSDEFRRHVLSREFRRVLMAMDMCCQKPEVTLGDLVARRGMHVLRAIFRSGRMASDQTGGMGHGSGDSANNRDR